MVNLRKCIRCWIHTFIIVFIKTTYYVNKITEKVSGDFIDAINAATGGWNFNWIDVTAVDSEVAGVDESTIASRLMVYPVPASHTLTVNTGDTMGNSETSYTVQNIITGSMYVVSAADQVLDIARFLRAFMLFLLL